MYKYQIDCENAMNVLLEQLKANDIRFDRLDIIEAFESCDEDSIKHHLLSARKHNICNTLDKLLDYACACDLLIEYKDNYIAVDWTDNEVEIINKVNKHKWLAPIYNYLGIKYTLVIKAEGYLSIKNRSQEMVARLKASGDVLNKIDKMITKEDYNSSLILKIKVNL